MKLVFLLALRDLMRDRIQLVCNVAVITGVLVPLMVLFGVKNGVYDALIGRLLSNPANLQIDTSGNASFSPADAEEVAGWPEAAFVTLKTRSMFDFVNVRAVSGGPMRDAVVVPSGTGDPYLPDQLALAADEVALSAQLATQLNVASGESIHIVTQSERARQLVFEYRVAALVPSERLSGRSVLAGIDTLDQIEAFYDGFALPEHGIADGKPLDQRVADFEGIRAFARRLEDLAPLQSKLESRFGISTEANTRTVAATLALGTNLNLALALTAAVASIGLAAALVFGFWGEVMRKMRVMATLALIGIAGERLILFPIVQAGVSAGLALVISFAMFWLAGSVASSMFGGGLQSDESLVLLTVQQAMTIVLAVLGFVLVASLFAARAALRVDPATVLRDGE
ncbi:ABC transporter permease [Roseobacter sp. A03A-229]